jgi:hypothetical protein
MQGIFDPKLTVLRPISLKQEYIRYTVSHKEEQRPYKLEQKVEQIIEQLVEY